MSEYHLLIFFDQLSGSMKFPIVTKVSKKTLQPVQDLPLTKSTVRSTEATPSYDEKTQDPKERLETIETMLVML